MASAYGQLDRAEYARGAVDKANALRAEGGWGALDLEAVDFWRWVGDKERLRKGLAKAGVGKGVDWFFLLTSTEGGYEIDGAIKIDTATAKELHQRGVPFVDTYPLYVKGRIPGAYHMGWWRGSYGERQREFNEVRLLEVLDESGEVVVYSSGAIQPAAFATGFAVSQGFKNVYYFEDGLKGWKAAGYTVEK